MQTLQNLEAILHNEPLISADLKRSRFQDLALVGSPYQRNQPTVLAPHPYRCHTIRPMDNATSIILNSAQPCGPL